jgi:hypothetical protein
MATGRKTGKFGRLAKTKAAFWAAFDTRWLRKGTGYFSDNLFEFGAEGFYISIKFINPAINARDAQKNELADRGRN